jgi:hypothetical protein
MATVQAPRGTLSMVGTESSNIRDVADRINLLQPDAAPLIAFLSALKRKKEATQPKFEWFEDDLIANTVTAAGSAQNSTTITVSAADGLIVRNGDILIAPNGESIRVTSGEGGTSLTVVRALGTTPTAYSLNSGDVLIIAGNAALEGGSTPTYRFVNKASALNYIQIFRDPVKITTTVNASKFYGGDERTYQRKKVAIEHKRGIENALLFGNASQTSDSVSGYTRTTKGLFNWISTNVTDMGGVITEGELESFLRSVFRYPASTGPASKVLLCSPIMVSALNFWAKNALQVRSDEKVYGMRVASYRSGHGDLDFVRHWLLGDYSSTGASGSTLYGTAWNQFSFCIDPTNLQYRFLSGLDTKLHTDIGQPTEEYTLDEYRTHCGLQLEQEKTHGIIKNVTGFAA